MKKFLKWYSKGAWTSLILGVLFLIIYSGKNSKDYYLWFSIGLFILGFIQLFLAKKYKKKSS